MPTPNPVEEDSPPLPKKGRGARTDRSRPTLVATQDSPVLASAIPGATPTKADEEAAFLTPLPARKSRRQLYLNNPLLDLQAKEENSSGNSLSGASNSDDDDNEQNLSCVSSGTHHSNAEKHVYMQGMDSQGEAKFPTPIHLQRASFEGRVPLAGECCACLHVSPPLWILERFILMTSYLVLDLTYSRFDRGKNHC